MIERLQILIRSSLFILSQILVVVLVVVVVVVVVVLFLHPGLSAIKEVAGFTLSSKK